MADEMGILRTDVEIESPLREGDRRLLRDVLVDTGAELSWAPAPVLESLGIRRRKPSSPMTVAIPRCRLSRFCASPRALTRRLPSRKRPINNRNNNDTAAS